MPQKSLLEEQLNHAESCIEAGKKDMLFLTIFSDYVMS